MDNEQSESHSFEHLMRLAQQGDKKAYAQLFQEITPLLRAFVRKKISRAEDMEDIVQEILISIHRASKTYDTARPFKAWMFTIARFRLNDHLRGLYKNRAQGAEISYEDADHNLLEAAHVTESYESREYINKLLAHLPKKQKKIITMMKIEGYTAKEIATALKMTESAVKVSAHRAYKVLATRAKEEK
ncbi:MAG: sigma-70 family RNA polymerase sigma factor [Alphaproteobacteria bacterium]|nr:sigma-70 family RNA polymerase sigma factor [Alphaproteobacteria bacterium]